MKKIIFGILSLFLISPVLADNYDLVHNVFVSFENVNNSDNITYGLYYNFSRSSSTFYNVSPFYFSSSSVPSYDISFFPSESSINGSSYSDSNGFNAFSIASNSSIIGRSDGSSYGSLFSIGKNGDSYNPSIFNYYYQASSSSSWVPNVTLNFGNYVSGGNGDLISDNSFLRFFYNSDSFFTSGYFPSINNSVPFDFQYFTLYSPYVKTIKGQAGLGFDFNRISSSIGNGFSFINFSSVYSDLRFFSVFPNWDYTWGNESTFDITSFSDKFYMFRLDSNKYHSDINNIGVISKCDSVLCSGLSLDIFYSSLVYSEYICSISSSINIKNDCVLVYGGILSGVLGNLSSADSSINLQSNNFIKYFLSSISDFNNFGNSVPVYFSSDINGNNLSVSTNSVTVDGSRHSAGYFTYSFPVTLLGFTPDILSVIPFNQGNNNSSSITTGEAESGSINKCLFDTNYYLLNSLFCNSLGVYIGADGVPVLNTSSSGSCLKIIQAFNDSGDLIELTVSCEDAQNFLSGGFYQDSQGNIYYKCLGDTCLYTNTSQYFQSGIVSDSYYNSDSLFFSCPYPIITGSNNILSRFSNIELGQFSIGLPIACFYSAFVHGKNYRFLSDVNLGLNPIMGDIQSINDPRHYLYGFFDFLLSFAVFMFLLKLYHLIK